MSDGDILARMGTDATKWAEECVKIVGIRMGEQERANCEEILRGWFANAIGAGETAGQKAYAIHMEIERIENSSTGSKEEQAGAIGALEWVQQGCPEGGVGV